ncbi:MAG: arginine--tRNA ligase [Candidatus Absconditabacterales bacterium]
MINLYKKYFAEILGKNIDLPIDEILELIEIPPENIPGDLAFPCFKLSKILKKSPNVIAQEIKEKIEHGKIGGKKSGKIGKEIDSDFEKFLNIGGYVNAEIKKSSRIKNFFQDISKQQRIQSDKGHKAIKEKIIVEYMSANPNKPLHIGQARNICIGDSIRRVFEKLGYETHSFDYGDDSGVNVGYNIVGHLHYGLPLDTDKKFDHYCGEVYKKMKEKSEDPEFKKTLSETLLKIEEGSDENIKKVHNDYTNKCTLQQLKTCRRLNSSFDAVCRETDILHLKFLSEAFDLLKSKGHIKCMNDGDAKGCWVIDLSSLENYANEEKKYQILIKSDGVATYIAKDIAFALWKLGYLKKDFTYDVFANEPNGKIMYSTHSQGKNEKKGFFGNYNQAITVVDNRQLPAQEVVSSALKLLGYTNENKKYMPLGYGVVYLTPQTLSKMGFKLSEEEKAEKRLPFASRKGRTVTIDEMMEMLHQKSYGECKERNPEKISDRLDKTAEKIAVGSLRFFLTKTDISKDIIFDIDEVLDMQGETGAYVLYTGARIQSVIDMEEFGIGNLELENKEITKKIERYLIEDEEFNLVKKISEFENIIFQIKNELAPHLMCRFLLELCKLTNVYYANVKILKSEGETKNARIFLLKKIIETLKTGLNLIGIEFVDRM